MRVAPSIHRAKRRTVPAVREYWDSHPLGKQFVLDENLVTGTPEFFAYVRPWMGPFKFSWIMKRIEREATRLNGGHLLEVGCGLGFESLEFVKHGVRVTATDLSPTAVEMTDRHFEIEGLRAEDVRTENVLALSFNDNTFDAVWANGVLQHTGDAAQAVREIHRVLKPGGRAIVSHFYRRPSWMYWLSRLGRENIEFKEEDPPVTDFLTEREILALFRGFVIEEAVPNHFRALPISRRGFKAAVYTWGFRPLYNLLPEFIAKSLAHKYSITAIKA